MKNNFELFFLKKIKRKLVSLGTSMNEMYVINLKNFIRTENYEQLNKQ